MTADFELTADFKRAQRAIARVTARGEAGEKKTGTAFFVGGRYALTALHVVADKRTQPPQFLPSITLEFPGPGGSTVTTVATVAERLWNLDDDWAVLECEATPDADPIELGPEPALKSEWHAHGYPEIQPRGMTIEGTVSNPNLLPLGEYKGTPELPSLPVLQLLCEQASAGKGAPMHGFSGAPCLVDGKAVGILRSTLIEEELVEDQGQPRRLLFTQAGTVYATPASSLVDVQAVLRKAAQPPDWANIVAGDFLVLLSQREPSQDVKLQAVAEEVYRNIQDRGLGPPCFVYAAQMVASKEPLQECVRVLCKAKVVVFDATDFEPAMMFLAGIRAVVKRGVTLLSVGGDYALGKSLAIPFNVTDANIVAHSGKQDASTIGDSVTLLTQRIERGLDAMRSPQYLDLPVYDAIRRLPVERRGIIPNNEGVLVLCPFDEDYADFWEKLKQALNNELKKLRKGQNLAPSFGVSRSFELNSPRLVTHAVYEAIRRVQTCVIDLTGWSANVLFELGVRLAASGERTACIMEKGWEGRLKAANLTERWLPQCRSIESLFVAEALKYDSSKSWQGEPAFRSAYGPDAQPLEKPLLVDGALHALIERELDVDLEPASRTVFLDLRDQAATFERDPRGGLTKPVGMFAGNRSLVEREDVAEFERLLAAWLYVSNRYTTDQILDDAETRNVVYDVVQALFVRHDERLDPDVTRAAGEMMDNIEDWRKQHGGSPAG